MRSLLARGASPHGCKEIADKTGIAGKAILEWVNHVDLFRIKGVQQEYADLLEEAGVDTVPELAQRNAANLHEKIVTVNRIKYGAPTADAGRSCGWIEQARTCHA